MPCEFYLGPGNWALRDDEAVIGNIELKPLFKAAAKANETVTFILTELADGLEVRGRIRDHRLPRGEPGPCNKSFCECLGWGNSYSASWIL